MTDDLVKRLRDVDHLCVEDCFLQSPLYAYAADRIEQLGRERDAAIAALEESGRKRGETLALLDKAADALKTIAHLADGERVGGIARAVLTEIEGGKKDE